jgi:hypothetical protein
MSNKDWRQWRPHIDLTRLSTALSEEILSAAEWEVRLLRAETGYSVTAVAQDVRDLIAMASGERGDAGPEVLLAEGGQFSAFCIRQH